jgi:hypothetical protein
MSEQARLQVFSTLILMVLLFATAFSNSLVLFGIAIVLVLGGLVLLPQLRALGALAAIVGATLAAVIVVVMRLARLA